MHTVLGFFMCSIAYGACVLTTNNLHKLFVSYKLIDSVLTAVTGEKLNIRNYSNRFQMNLISSGLVLYIVIMAVDATVYKM